MINKARIVPVTKSDLLTLYGTMLNLTTGNGVTFVNPKDDNGNFEVRGQVSCLCSEPVRSLEIDSASASNRLIYFVAGYNFEGLTVDGNPFEYPGTGLDIPDIPKDCATLVCVVPSDHDAEIINISPMV